MCLKEFIKIFSLFFFLENQSIKRNGENQDNIMFQNGNTIEVGEDVQSEAIALTMLMTATGWYYLYFEMYSPNIINL